MPGDSVKLTVLRDGKELEIPVILEPEQPQREQRGLDSLRPGGFPKGDPHAADRS